MTIPPTSETENALDAVEGLRTGIAPMLSHADATALGRMQTLTQVQQARTARLTRAAAAETTRYGAGSSQATAAEAAVAASKATAARIMIAKQRLTTPIRQVPETEWALHGRVFDAQLSPVVGNTVFLVDSQNNYQSAYGFAYTDSTGYFSLSSENAPPSPTQAPAQEASPQLFVAIVNAAAQPVYLSKTAFVPAIGAAVYQEIALPSEAPIGDPSAAIRSVAFPRTKRK